jgi:hypothetical protein
VIHIHNGDVAAALARRVAIPGEHLSFREALIAGPVRPGDHWLAVRARFLAEAYGEELLRVSNNLFEQEQVLAAAADNEEIVLWFEHDLFCLVHFVYLLSRFDERKVTAIWCRDAIGTMVEDRLPDLFESRAAVTPAMAATAREVWAAYASTDPTSLNRWLHKSSPDFPFLNEGLTLHASRFPSLRNGLGSVDNRLLTLIDAGAADFATLFERFDIDRPHFGFGDTEVLRLLKNLAAQPVPLVTITYPEGSETPPKALFALTPAGETLRAAGVDALTMNDPDVWLGGTHVTRQNLWRYDEERNQIIPNPAAG